MSKIEPAMHFTGASNTRVAHIGWARPVTGGVRTLCGTIITVSEGYRISKPDASECRRCRESWNKLTSHGEHIAAHGSMTLPSAKRWVANIEYKVVD